MTPETTIEELAALGITGVKVRSLEQGTSWAFGIERQKNGAPVWFGIESKDPNMPPKKLAAIFREWESTLDDRQFEK